jgi:hypothetical protein
MAWRATAISNSSGTPCHGAPPLVSLGVGGDQEKNSNGAWFPWCATIIFPSSGVPGNGAPLLYSSSAPLPWCSTARDRDIVARPFSSSVPLDSCTQMATVARCFCHQRDFPKMCMPSAASPGKETDNRNRKPEDLHHGLKAFFPDVKNVEPQGVYFFSRTKKCELNLSLFYPIF